MGLQVDIKKRMGNFLLDVAFKIDCETLAILGASGSGKSMTLKCIAGIETPDEGKIILDGEVLFDSEKKINLSPQKRGIGYLFQNYALFPNMTVEENIGAGLHGSQKEKQKIIEEKVKAFFLEGLEKKKPNQLSGGQQQRVALARMIASEPKIIMLDEPFSALDSYLRWQLEQEILDIMETYHRPTLFVSHNRDEVYRMSDSIGVIDRGKLEFVSEKKKLFQNPQLLTAAVLTGCKNFTRIKCIEEYKVEALDWQMELKTNIPVRKDMKYIGIRAHHIQVVMNEEQGDNILDCRVLRTIENTFTTIIMLENNRQVRKMREDDFDKYAEIRLEMDKDEWEKVKGDSIKIKFAAEELLLLK